MEVEILKNCSICGDHHEVIYTLEDSIESPKGMYFNRIYLLIETIRKILKITPANAHYKICKNCHDKFYQIYIFFEQCVKAEQQNYSVAYNFKNETITESYSTTTTLRILSVDDGEQARKHRLADDDDIGLSEGDEEIPLKQIKRSSERFNDNDHVTEKPRKFVCSVCGKSYKNYNSLKDHRRIHKGLTYKCSECPAVFNYSQSLRLHKQNHATNSLKYSCNICHTLFITSQAVKLHKNRSHGRRETTKKIKANKTKKKKSDICVEEKENKASQSGPEIMFMSDETNDVESSNLLIEDPLGEEEVSSKKVANVSRSSSRIRTRSAKRVDPSPVREEVEFKDPELEIKCLEEDFIEELIKEEIPDVEQAIETLEESFEDSEVDLAPATEIDNSESTFACCLCDEKFSKLLDLEKHNAFNHPDEDAIKQSPTFDENGRQTYICTQCPSKYRTIKGLLAHRRSHFGISFQCDQCPAKFLYPSSLRKHNQLHAGIRHKCSQCDAHFSTKDSQKNHYLREHKSVRFECPKCQKELTSRDALRYHMGLHEKKNYKCDDCASTFRLYRSLAAHRLKRHDQQNYYCDQCAAEFTDIASLRAHIRYHTGDMFECAECKWHFTSAGEAEFHKVVHENGHLICEFCEARYTHLRDFNAHKRYHSGELFKCTRCPASFMFFNQLRKHKLIHLSDRTRDKVAAKEWQTAKPTTMTKSDNASDGNFSCNKCGAKYDSLESLKLHEATHYVIQLQCTQCPESFTSNRKLAEHRRTHPGEKSYKCPDCNAAYSKTIDLIAHRRTHTGEMIQCSECSASFSRADRLKEHMRVHTGDTFNCGFCDSKFTTKWAWKKHELVHSAVKPYACDQCDFKTIYKTALAGHRTTHVDGNVSERTWKRRKRRMPKKNKITISSN